jgi:hypothetical protein
MPLEILLNFAFDEFYAGEKWQVIENEHWRGAKKTQSFHYVSIELIQSVYDKNIFLPRHENAGDQNLSQIAQI